MYRQFLLQLRLGLVGLTTSALISVTAFGQAGQPLTTVTASGQAEQPSIVAAAVQAAAQAAAPALASGSVRRLSADEAVRLALEQNLGIQIQRIDPQIQDLGIAQSRSFWVPQVTSSFSNNSNNSPSTSFLAGTGTSIISGQLSNTLGVSQLLPWGGGNYQTNWSSLRATTTDVSQTFNPRINSQLAVSYTQPLLRNFKIDNVRQQVLLSRKMRDLSDVQLRTAMIQTARGVKNAYWQMVYQIDNLKAARQSLELAQQSLRDNSRRVEIGTMAPIDIVDAKVEVARNEEAVIIAGESIANAEDQLKMLIFDPATTDFWNFTIEPTDTVPFQKQAIDTEAAVRSALDKRTDLAQAKNTIAQSDVSMRYFRNQILPDVNAQANYLTTGLGGVQLSQAANLFDPNSPASREILGQRSYGSTLGDVLRSSYPGWSFGVQVGYPLGTSTAQANLGRAKLAYQQSQIQLKNLEMQIVAQVRASARQVQANQKRVESATASRELAEQKLDAEEKKFAAGIRETFFVFQAQRDLSAARSAEVRAIADYAVSLVDFEAVQEVSIVGGSGGVTNAGSGAIQTSNAILRQ